MGVDRNKVRLTGENSFLRLSKSPDTDPSAQASHWRIHVSPKGPGHVLFINGDLTSNETQIYADNFALARWLQEGIQGSMGKQYSGTDMPIIEAEFGKTGDTFSCWSEYVESLDSRIVLSWFDFSEPVVIANSPGEKPSQPHGVYSVLVPAARAQMTLDGVAARGSAQPRPLDDATNISTCCLALSETWTIPGDHKWARERVC